MTMSSSEHNACDSTLSVSFAQFMETCLYGPDGYYQKKAKLGGRGADFYTSAQFPLFGLTLGKYVLDWWKASGETRVIQIAEFGPGQGELAEAVCTYLAENVERDTVIRYLLVERADAMMQAQASRLSQLCPRIDFCWGKKVDAGLDFEIPTIALANEWLDALPVERVMKTDDAWLQAYVVKDATSRSHSFVWKKSTERVSKAAAHSLPIPAGHIGEVCLFYPEVLQMISCLAKLGHAVFIDYGSTYAELESGLRPEGTLRAYRQHELVNVLADAGFADITADVNWDYFGNEARQHGFTVYPLKSQAVFLMEAGILGVAEERMKTVPEKSNEHALHVADVGREIKTLVMPGGLGERFSVLTCDWNEGDARAKC